MLMSIQPISISFLPDFLLHLKHLTTMPAPSVKHLSTSSTNVAASVDPDTMHYVNL